jgi:hypothetical protein
MTDGAGVNSLAVLRDWYAALVEFRTDAQNALSETAQAIQCVDSWLDEQEKYWHKQVRLSEDAVIQAKTELRTRQFATLSGERPDCTVQEQALRQAKARLEFSEDRLKNVRRWMKRLPTETRDNYDGPVHQLDFFLDGDLPRGLALLSRQLTALEQYANLRAPSTSGPALPAAPDKEKP